MNITFEEAVELINEAEAIIIDDDALTYPVYDEEMERIEMKWETDEGLGFELYFTKEMNKEVEVDLETDELKFWPVTDVHDDTKTCIKLLRVTNLKNIFYSDR